MTKLHFDDLTQITCPFGMLDDDTQERLKACDSVEFYSYIGGWSSPVSPSFACYVTYRAKPKPKRVVTWVQWDESNALCGEDRHEADRHLKMYGGYIYRIERDEDGSNPTIELVATGGKNE